MSLHSFSLFHKKTTLVFCVFHSLHHTLQQYVWQPQSSKNTRAGRKGARAEGRVGNRELAPHPRSSGGEGGPTLEAIVQSSKHQD